MLSAKALEILIEGLGIELAGPVVSHVDEPNRFYAFVKISYGQDGRKFPNKRKITSIRDAALESGYSVELVPVDERSEGSYPDLRILLNRKFGDQVRNVFLTYVSKAEWVAWVEMDGAIEDTLQDEIESTISEYLRLFDMKINKVSFVGDLNLPTLTAILRILRVLAPACSERLGEELQTRGFFVPNPRWLNHTLDRIRKAGFVIRRKDGRYFLSIKSLSSLGTSKGRESADVQRALAVWKNLH